MRIFFLLIFLTQLNCFSQSNTIKVDYAFSLSIGNYSEYKTSLYINKKETLFLWGKPAVDQKDDDIEGANVTINLNHIDSIGSYNYSSFLKDSVFSRMPYFNNKIFLLKEKTPIIDWEITSETKKIGSYNSQKAITKFRGRFYTAWFTNEIPIKSGPWKLQGLPGLILVAYDASKEIQFVFTGISKSKYKIQFKTDKNQIISLKEFKEIQANSSQNLFKKLKSKLPRGAKIEIQTTKAMEIFNK